MKQPLYICEGARNVGKTFLLSNPGLPLPVYKLPFVDYFKRFLTHGAFEDDRSNKGSHHFTAGYDVTVLGLHGTGVLEPCILDRGFLSNIVLGVMQERITDDEAKSYISMLGTMGLLDNICVINVTAKFWPDDRGKDDWSFLDYGNSRSLFQYYGMLAEQESGKLLRVVEFENRFDQDSVRRFNELFQNPSV